MRHISLESLSLDIPVWCQLVGPTRHVPDPGTAQGAFPVSGRAVDLPRTPRAADAGASGWAEPPGRPPNLRGPPPPRALPGDRWVRNRSATTAPRLRTRAGPARRAITVKPRPGAAAQAPLNCALVWAPGRTSAGWLPARVPRWPSTHLSFLVGFGEPPLPPLGLEAGCWWQNARSEVPRFCHRRLKSSAARAEILPLGPRCFSGLTLNPQPLAWTHKPNLGNHDTP